MSEEEAFAQLKTAAATLQIGLGAFEDKIRNVLLSIYVDGVFFRSPAPTIQAVDATAMSSMNENAAINYILAKCERLGIPVFLVRGHLINVVKELYRNDITLVVGPGALQNMGRAP